MEAHHPRDQFCPRGVHCTPQMLTACPGPGLPSWAGRVWGRAQILNRHLLSRVSVIADTKGPVGARDLLQLGWGQCCPAPLPTRCAGVHCLGPLCPGPGGLPCLMGPPISRLTAGGFWGSQLSGGASVGGSAGPAAENSRVSWRDPGRSVLTQPRTRPAHQAVLLALPARGSVGLACPPQVLGRAGAGFGEGVGAGGGRPWPPGRFGVKGQVWGSACLWRPQASEPSGVLIAYLRCGSYLAL